MFGKLTKEKIAEAITEETNSAIEKYGTKYSTIHEGYAILKEEVDESRDEHITIRNNMFKLWDDIRFNDNEKALNHVKLILEHSEKLALEAIQVCAVCNKILKG